MSTPLGDSSGIDTGASLGTGGAEGGNAGAQQVQDGLANSTPANDTSSQASDSANSGSGFNPAWKGLLDKIPTQFHPIIADDLKQWDRNYGQLAQQYAPYKQFTQQGLSPEVMQNAVQMYQMLDQNPAEVYRRLGELLRVNEQQGQQQFANNDEDTEDDEYEYEDDSVTNDPRFQQMQQQLAQLQNMVQSDVQSRQQAQLTTQYENQIEQTLSAIEQQNGKFDRQDVLQRVAAQMQMGQQPDIVKAYQEQQAFIQSVTGQQRNAPPKIMPTNGGIPPNTQNTSLNTPTDRRKRFEELMNLAKNS